MNEILSNTIVLLLLSTALAGLVAWVRNDTFGGTERRTPTTDTVVPDEPPAPAGLPQRDAGPHGTRVLQFN